MRLSQVITFQQCIHFYLIIGIVRGSDDASTPSARTFGFFDALTSFIWPDRVNFYLWTRRNANALQELILEDVSDLRDSYFNIRAPTKIYVHGFNEHGSDDNAILLKNQLLMNQDCNFLSVDWADLARRPKYERAVKNVEQAAESATLMIGFLLEQGANINSFHLIGFSLGAHVCGRVGALFMGHLPRITGLDPAFPSFSLANRVTRLDRSDARFVDIIHTNGGVFAFPWSIGHVDFYVNGGAAQPACPFTDSLSTELDNSILALGATIASARCSHQKAVAYFTESVNTYVGFYAIRCYSWIEYLRGTCRTNAHTYMGLHVPIGARGDYFLITNNSPPFARG